MTTLDPKLESFFTLRNLKIRRGDETPEFEGVMVIKGRDVAHVKNRGTGGANVYHWIEPFSRKWAEERLFPLASKIASAKEPEFQDLYSKSHSTALDSLVFDAVEREREARSASRRRHSYYENSEEARQAFESELTAHAARVEARTTGLRIDAKVEFGRENGEKTQGVVKKINKKSVLVVTVEDRGRYPKGTRFRVAPALLTVLS